MIVDFQGKMYWLGGNLWGPNVCTLPDNKYWHPDYMDPPKNKYGDVLDDAVELPKESIVLQDIRKPVERYMQAPKKERKSPSQLSA